MNAEEARKKSLEKAREIAKPEIEMVKSLIEKTVNQGKTSVALDEGFFLQRETLEWLKQNGYEYYMDDPETASDGRFYSTISW